MSFFLVFILIWKAAACYKNTYSWLNLHADNNVIYKQIIELSVDYVISIFI